MRYTTELNALEDLHALEREADRLLGLLPDDPNCPAVSEMQLMRSRREGRVCSLEAMDEAIVCETEQDILDELCFLMSVTPLSARERTCLRGWMMGYPQRTFGQFYLETLPPCSQQTAARALMRGLLKCLSGCGLTFRQFSRHTVYRRPAHRERHRMSVCPRCNEEFCYGLGAGRFCCSQCRESRG